MLVMPIYIYIALPLEYIPFNWNSDHKEASIILKETLITAPILRHCDPTLPTRPGTAVIEGVLGAVLEYHTLPFLVSAACT
jgi:hypothetical protein